MPRNLIEIVRTAEAAIAEQNAEIAAARQRQLQSVIAQAASGSGNIDAQHSLPVRFRLVFVRCHFVGSAGAAPLSLSLDSVDGATYDVTLFRMLRAGVNRDVNLRIPAEESADPSPWTFQAGDALRIQWTNPAPGSIAWGLEVGLALAS